jgi:hypothetical protein
LKLSADFYYIELRNPDVNVFLKADLSHSTSPRTDELAGGKPNGLVDARWAILYTENSVLDVRGTPFLAVLSGSEQARGRLESGSIGVFSFEQIPGQLSGQYPQNR